MSKAFRTEVSKMTDRELLELIAKQVGVLTSEVGSIKEDVGNLSKQVDTLTNELIKTNNVIENDIKPKIESLFDGYVQNQNKLDRIEAEVAKRDEFILKRVR